MIDENYRRYRRFRFGRMDGSVIAENITLGKR